MADQLYLSLWFPNFRLESLPAALTCVMRQFARISGDPRVVAAAAYPIAFREAPLYQRVYVTDDRSEENRDTAAAAIDAAVAEATEQLHDDMAYEFEMKWRLWLPETEPGEGIGLDVLWKPQPVTVRILGFGPAFDEGDYEQNGHVRVDFGLDHPWTLAEEEDGSEEEEEDTPGDVGNVLAFRSPIAAAPGHDDAETAGETAQYIRRNVEALLAFTLSVEKHCGISSRLLWTESGEPLAEKLIAQLQRLN